MASTSSQDEWQLGESATGIRIHLGYGIFLILLIAIFSIRFVGSSANTIFYDEAVNITLGWEAVSGDFTQDATSWIFGSYLYPMISGTVHHYAGDIGIRLFTAALNTLAVIFIFFLTRDLFDHRSALLATLLFGFSGANISLGQLAVYDSLGLPIMTAAFYCVIQAGLVEPDKMNRYLLAAGVTLGLSILTKYIGLLFLPALFWFAIVFFLWRGRPLKSVLLIFFPTTIFILGGYFLWNQEDLVSLWVQREMLLFYPEERWVILRSYLSHAGVSLFFAFIGVLFIPSFPNPDMPAVSPKQKGFFLMFLAFATMVAAYQIFSENIQSLWKHAAYSSIFFAPFAGFGLSRLMAKGRYIFGKGNGDIPYRLLYSFISIVCIIWFINLGLAQNWGLTHSWPNLSGANAYLQSQPLTLDTRILAEESAVYEYYNDFGAYDRDVWSNTFYMEYRGFQGADAMVAGIRDHYFDIVILDDYYTPETNQHIRDALIEYDYQLVYQDPVPQQLSTGQVITVNIYRSP
ncbi:ArnT family glycosyltransferase [Candidatus Leptofilum sp.]|uniref:ArnT family glycosyltransferase n=1 Tax=Candidatus Leptofilum sp. TaxID=3241576 RepID=UPI003B5B1C72